MPLSTANPAVVNYQCPEALLIGIQDRLPVNFVLSTRAELVDADSVVVEVSGEKGLGESWHNIFEEGLGLVGLAELTSENPRPRMPSVAVSLMRLEERVVASWSAC